MGELYELWYLSITEAAKILNLSISTIFTRLKTKKPGYNYIKLPHQFSPTQDEIDNQSIQNPCESTQK